MSSYRLNNDIIQYSSGNQTKTGWLTTIIAALLAAATFLILPVIESLTAPAVSTPSEPIQKLHLIDIAPPPPPKTTPTPDTPVPPPPAHVQPEPEQPATTASPTPPTPIKLPSLPTPSLVSIKHTPIPTQNLIFPVNTASTQVPTPAVRHQTDNLDSPPRPLSQPRPQYPFRARQQNIEGYVEAEFTVGTDGRVTDITIVAAKPDHVFVNTVRRALAACRFKPAVRQGQPVSVRFRQRFTFNLEN